MFNNMLLNTATTLRYQRKKGGNGAVVAIVAVIVLIVMFSVVYVLIQSSSKATWSGEIDSRMIDVKWYNSTGEWEMWESSGAISSSSEDDSDYDWLYKYDSLQSECQVSSSTTYCEIDVEDWVIEDETFNVDYDVKSQLLGDVMFSQITWMQVIYEDGEAFSDSDPFNGECIATVHEDVYDGWYSWRNAVNNVNSTYGNWPSWCNCRRLLIESKLQGIAIVINGPFLARVMTEVAVQTSAGDIRIKLFTEEAPETTANFLKLVDMGVLQWIAFP